MQDLNLDLTTPSPQNVAQRIVVLKHLVVYSIITPPRELLTKMSAGWSSAEREDFRKSAEKRRDEFWARLRQLGLHDALSPKELEFSHSTMLTMSAQQQQDASWRVEAFQVLLWALGYLPSLPPFHQMCDHQILKDFPPADLQTFIASAKLRSDEELEQFRQLAELWHWRSHTRQLNDKQEPLIIDNEMQQAGLSSYDDLVRVAAELAHENGDLPDLINNDFPVKDKAFRDLPIDEWASVKAIVVERLFAANWLCGLAPNNSWDLTPTDV